VKEFWKGGALLAAVEAATWAQVEEAVRERFR
jgi:hypothetical protein